MKEIKTRTFEFLSEKEIQLIRKDCCKAEINGKLTDDVLDLIYQKAWLKIMEPASCNGLEWSLPKVVHLFESLAYADGNVGWCVNLGAGANLFSGYLQEKTAKKVFSGSKTWCAGSGAISGKASKVKGGFLLSGRWKYASGSAHATHFTANAFLFDENKKPIQENGKQLFRSFIFPAEKITVLNTWHVSGLKATSSNEFEVNEILVPEEAIFSLTKPSPFAQAPIFHFPFDALAVVNMACMPTGIALHFLELFEELMITKIPLHSTNPLGKQKVVQDTFLNCKTSFLTDREEMYQSLEEAWEQHLKEGNLSKKSLKNLSKKSKKAAESARAIIHHLFPLCGMNILFSGSELNKVWRDLSVAGQHYLLSPISE